MSTLIVKNLDAPTGESIVAPDLQLPQGAVVQVRNRLKSNMEAYSSHAWHTVLEDTITPSSSASTILITGIVAFSMSAGDGMVRIERTVNSTATVIGGGTEGSNLSGIAGQASGSYNAMTTLAACSYEDSPSSSSTVTYKLQIRGDQPLYVNRRGVGTDFGSGTYLTLMEIAG